MLMAFSPMSCAPMMTCINDTSLSGCLTRDTDTRWPAEASGEKSQSEIKVVMFVKVKVT